jgi:hypothetical protein
MAWSSKNYPDEKSASVDRLRCTGEEFTGKEVVC